jgi:tetratricopeptide (TPR) repeat protein
MTKKYMAFQFVMFGFLLVLLVSGCSRKEEEVAKPKQLQAPTQNAEQQTKLFLSEPLPLQRVEVSSEALAVWRQYSEQKPTLFLLSNDPMLIPVPEPLRAETASTINTGEQAQIAERSTLRRADPLMLPVMTVDAALRNGWFGRLAWALPIRDAELELSQEKFRKQMQESGIATEAELETVTVINNQVVGTLRATPFVAAALPNLPELTGPVIIHFDQSYFQQMYKNEIATPIFPLIFDTLKSLHQREIPVLAVTFAYGNLEGRIALDVRFVGEVLQAFVEKPELFEQPIPKTWKLQGDILYLDNFFQKEKKLELALEMEKLAPESAWVKFTLFKVAAENSMGTAALGSLAEAVAIDKVYALEYLSLSDMAYEKKRPDEALRMLKLAQEAFPDNFSITLQLAQLMAEQGQVDAAGDLVEPLPKLDWSKVYYPDMSESLQRFVKQLEVKQAE